MPNRDKQARRKFMLSRREWLRGTGVAVGLPWLESMPVWGQEPSKSDSGDEANAIPTRFGVLFMACGVHQCSG